MEPKFNNVAKTKVAISKIISALLLVVQALLSIASLYFSFVLSKIHAMDLSLISFQLLLSFLLIITGALTLGGTNKNYPLIYTTSCTIFSGIMLINIIQEQTVRIFDGMFQLKATYYVTYLALYYINIFLLLFSIASAITFGVSMRVQRKNLLMQKVKK